MFVQISILCDKMPVAVEYITLSCYLPEGIPDRIFATSNEIRNHPIDHLKIS